MDNRIDIKSMNYKELCDFVESIGEKKFRAKQIYEWIHVKHVESFDEMSNISKALKEKLENKCNLVTVRKEDV